MIAHPKVSLEPNHAGAGGGPGHERAVSGGGPSWPVPDLAELRLRRHRSLQYFTSSQQSRHLARQLNGRPQTRQGFSGRWGFLCIGAGRGDGQLTYAQIEPGGRTPSGPGARSEHRTPKWQRWGGDHPSDHQETTAGAPIANLCPLLQRGSHRPRPPTAVSMQRVVGQRNARRGRGVGDNLMLAQRAQTKSSNASIMALSTFSTSTLAA